MNRKILSLRAQSTPPSPIRKLTSTAQKTLRRGIKIYGLNIGQPDGPAPRAFSDQINTMSHENIPYAPSAGYEDVRKAWSRYYRSHHMPFNAEDILVTNGGSEAITFAFTAICDPGDEIIVFEPLYPNYISFAAQLNIKLIPISTTLSSGFHLPAEKDIVKKISSRTRAIIVCNPNNPTGTVYTRTELARVARIARRYSLFVIADETYREFVFTKASHVSMASFPAIRQRLIVVDSVSKRFNLCGARVGCLATKNKSILNATLTFAQARLSATTLEQRAIIPLLVKPTAYVRHARYHYKKRRDALIKALAHIPGCTYYIPEGAFYIQVALPVDSTERFCQWMIERFHVNRTTVLLAPGSGFYATPGKGTREVRIAFVLPAEELAHAVTILKKGIEVYNRIPRPS
ncbi:MAG: pyridoxal phosphate-dependent aminotransferase [Patescibacteria group bacterium]|jgi:aspartate aminotransferase